jgi:hypothetical protein
MAERDERIPAVLVIQAKALIVSALAEIDGSNYITLLHSDSQDGQHLAGNVLHISRRLQSAKGWLSADD